MKLAIKQRARTFITSFNFIGLLFGVIFFCFSMLPSLLPRPTLFQGIISGVSIAIGYGIGVLLSKVLRWLFNKEPLSSEAKKHAWRIFGIISSVLYVTFLFLGAKWQREVQELVGEQPSAQSNVLTLTLITLIVFLALLFIARGIRSLNRKVNQLLGKFIPPRVATVIGVTFVVFVLLWVVTGVFANFFVSTSNAIYSKKDNTTPPGVSQPTSPFVSGGPESLIPWDTLGYQGQAFTGRGPNMEQLRDFYGANVKQPIRVYAGLNSAETPEARADLAVQELKRTDAFNREVLILATATGTGWLEPQSVDSIEYIYGGDTAIVTQQYSYLPSWISFLVDKDNATNAALALYDAVYKEWSKMPAENRPKLIAYGLSLGSFGGQAPYAGIGDITASIDGALFVGTPSDTRLWRNVTDNRDAGSREILPVYKNGVSARFAATNEEITSNQESWQYPRVLYLQHASDPVVWFSFDLPFNEPDWLKEPRGYDVSPDTVWVPFVTFLQVTIDQFFGVSVPNGHGHNYPNSIVDAWVAVTNPSNWSTEKNTELQRIIATYSNE